MAEEKEGERGPDPMLWRGEQASEPGLCDGNAGGGQGQMPMEFS